MRKLLMLNVIGAVIELLGCVIGYFKGEFMGAVIGLVGACMILIGGTGIAVKYYKEKRDEKKRSLQD